MRVEVCLRAASLKRRSNRAKMEEADCDIAKRADSSIRLPEAETGIKRFWL